MHQNIHLHRRVLHGALVRLERSAAKVARCVLRGERSREAPDLPGDFDELSHKGKTLMLDSRVVDLRML